MMKTISLKLPADLERKLSARAKLDGKTKSALIRDAIEAHLLRGAGCAKGTFLELAGDLIGCLEGPGDLSYNKKHFKTFGCILPDDR
jgi:Ribbon-helix-helix protein, copG family